MLRFRSCQNQHGRTAIAICAAAICCATAGCQSSGLGKHAHLFGEGSYAPSAEMSVVGPDYLAPALPPNRKTPGSESSVVPTADTTILPVHFADQSSAPCITPVACDNATGTSCCDAAGSDEPNWFDFSCGTCRPYCHGCPPYDFRSDARAFLPLLRDDAHALLNWNNAAIMGAATAAAIALRQDADDQVRQDTASNPKRWGRGSEILGKFGDATYQVPVLLALYGYTLHQDDVELHHFTSSLFSAYTLTGLSTVAIKGIVNSDRPSDDWNDGQFGFPSFHTSSSFAIAAVIDEYHGPKAGLPAYAMAGLIGWSRIDERDHDLSDVIFGAALGYVIGKSVSGRHLYGDSRVRILPFTHPTEGSAGLMLDCPF